MRKLLFLLFFVLSGCNHTVQGDVTQTTPTVAMELLPEIKTPTTVSIYEPDGGVTSTPLPTSTPIPGYDISRPYWFTSKGKEMDFGTEGDAVSIEYRFIGVNETPYKTNTTYAKTAVFDAGEDINEVLASCRQKPADGLFNLVAAPAYDGDNEYPSWHKTFLVSHAGQCGTDLPNPFELPRIWLEGGWATPSSHQRETQLEKFYTKSLEDQEICFNQTCFRVVEIVFVDTETLEAAYHEDEIKYGKSRYTYIDRFFESGQRKGVHELFLAFCGSERQFSWFAAKYYIRLETIK